MEDKGTINFGCKCAKVNVQAKHFHLTMNTIYEWEYFFFPFGVNIFYDYNCWGESNFHKFDRKQWLHNRRESFPPTGDMGLKYISSAVYDGHCFLSSPQKRKIKNLKSKKTKSS